MSIRRGVILCAAVFGFGSWITTPAPAGTSYGHQDLGTRCVINETSYGSMVVAETSWRMWSNHESPDAYRWSARLVPHHPGFNFFRPWNEVEVGDVAAGPTSYDATVRTPPMSSNLDWDLQVQLTWDRAGQRDLNIEKTLDFDEGACAAA